MYRVVRVFKDKNTKRRHEVGQQYTDPREERIKFLLQLGYIEKVQDVDEPAIEKEDNNQYPIHLGGGYYELPSGEKIRGKAAAEKVMAGE